MNTRKNTRRVASNDEKATSTSNDRQTRNKKQTKEIEDKITPPAKRQKLSSVKDNKTEKMKTRGNKESVEKIEDTNTQTRRNKKSVPETEEKIVQVKTTNVQTRRKKKLGSESKEKDIPVEEKDSNKKVIGTRRKSQQTDSSKTQSKDENIKKGVKKSAKETSEPIKTTSESVETEKETRKSSRRAILKSVNTKTPEKKLKETPIKEEKEVVEPKKIIGSGRKRSIIENIEGVNKIKKKKIDLNCSVEEIRNKLSISTSSFYSTKTKNNLNKSVSVTPTAMKKLPIYKSVDNLNSSPKVCSLKMNFKEKPITEVDRLALYDFEIDSSEEKSMPKKKKKRIIKKQAINKKQINNKLISPRNGKLIKPPLQKSKQNEKNKSITQKFNTSFPSSTATVSAGQKSTVSLVSVPQKLPTSTESASTVFPVGVPQKPSTSTVNAVKKSDVSPVSVPQKSNMSSSIIKNIQKGESSQSSESVNTSYEESSALVNFEPAMPMMMHDSFNDTMPCSEESNNKSKLESLFDDDNELKREEEMRPVRFEYNEIANVRAKVLCKSINNKNQPVETAADVKFPNEPKQNLRQTTIKTFFGKEKEHLSNGIGLFSTGTSVEDMEMVSSTPQRPGNKQSIPSFLSPVGIISPEKVELRRSPRKLNLSPSKKAMPTRVSIGTLQKVVKSTKEKIQPVKISTPDLTDVLGGEKSPPMSPQRSFNKPPRKSYERKQNVRLAPKFMEVEEHFNNDASDEEEIEEEIIPKQKTHHKKHKDENPEKEKEFQEWASRYNSLLDDAEDFDLKVE